MIRRRAILAAIVVAGPLAAQTPDDQGRQPITQGQGSGSKNDDNRIPVLQGAGGGNFNTIQSFPDTSGGAVAPQQYLPPRPTLNPYLNLLRGSNGSGISAIDYYNFVRPAQQSLGSYGGRPLGVAPAFGGGGTRNSNYYAVDPETGLATTSRPAGIPAGFQNYGGYFNRLGTIGPGASLLTAPAPASTGSNLTGGRR